MRIEHEDHANSHGHAVGANMAGADAPYDHLPFFYSDLFDLGYEAVGIVDSRLEVVEDWQEPNRKGVVTYVEDGKPRGVLLWNVWDRLDDARDADPQPARARLPSRRSRPVAQAAARDGARVRVGLPAARASARAPVRTPARAAARCRRRPRVRRDSRRQSSSGAARSSSPRCSSSSRRCSTTRTASSRGSRAASSAFGRYLDSEVDLLVNAALFAGLGWTTGQPGARARRLPRADERPQPQLQRRAAVSRGGVPSPKRLEAARRRFSAGSTASSTPRRTGSPRRSSRAGRRSPSSFAVSRARESRNVDAARRVRTSDRCSDIPSSSPGSRSRRSPSSGSPLLPRRAPRQEEVA